MIDDSTGELLTGVNKALAVSWRGSLIVVSVLISVLMREVLLVFVRVVVIVVAELKSVSVGVETLFNSTRLVQLVLEDDPSNVANAVDPKRMVSLKVRIVGEVID